MDNLFMLYAYRTEICDDIAKDLAMSSDPNDPEIQKQIFSNHGINMNDLTSEEVKYIEERTEEILNF